MRPMSPAYAESFGAGGFGFSGLGSRRQRFWFAIVGMVGLCLPYVGGMVGALQRTIDAPAPAIVVPVLNVPVGQFPRLGVPKLLPYVAPVAAGAPAASAARSTAGTGSVARAASATTRRVTVVRHVVTPPAAPLVTNSYSLPSSSSSSAPAPKPAANHSASSSTVQGLAGALQKQPVVSNVTGPAATIAPSTAAVVAPAAPAAAGSVSSQRRTDAAIPSRHRWQPHRWQPHLRRRQPRRRLLP